MTATERLLKECGRRAPFVSWRLNKTGTTLTADVIINGKMLTASVAIVPGYDAIEAVISVLTNRVMGYVLKGEL